MQIMRHVELARNAMHDRLRGCIDGQRGEAVVKGSPPRCDRPLTSVLCPSGRNRRGMTVLSVVPRGLPPVSRCWRSSSPPKHRPTALPATLDSSPRRIIANSVVSGSEAQTGDAPVRCHHDLGYRLLFPLRRQHHGLAPRMS